MADDNAKLGGVQASDNAGPKGLEGVTVLAAKHGPIGLLPIPLTDIVPDAVAKDIIQGVFLGDLPRLLAYDYCELSLRLHCSRTVFRHDDVFLGANERMHRAKIGLGPGRVVRSCPAPLGHAFDMATVVGTCGVEHRWNNGKQELYLAECMASTRHRMFCKWTAGHLDDPVVFDNAVADLLSYLEATPLHGIYPRWLC